MRSLGTLTNCQHELCLFCCHFVVSHYTLIWQHKWAALWLTNLLLHCKLELLLLLLAAKPQHIFMQRAVQHQLKLDAYLMRSLWPVTVGRQMRVGCP